MPSERSLSALDDIAANVGLALSFTEGITRDAFVADVKTFYAVVRCLEIVSEASRRLDAEMFDRHPGLPWKAIHGAGNVYRHDYGDVTPDIVFATVRDALPDLLAAVEAELARSA